MRLRISMINRIRRLIICWACDPYLTKVTDVFDFRFIILHIFQRNPEWIPFLSYEGYNSGPYLDRMFTFQLFSIIITVTFLSDVVVEDYPASFHLIDSAIKITQCYFAFILTAELLSFTWDISAICSSTVRL